MSLNIYHLLPANNIGGAEIAASTTLYIKNKFFNFRVIYLFGKIKHKEKYRLLKNIYSFFLKIKFLLKQDTYILVSSLWKSNLAAIFISLVRKDVKIIPFLHSQKNWHFVDAITTNIAIFLANEIWVDSQATIDGRLKNFCFNHKEKKVRIISFMNYRLKKIPFLKCHPNFIFWGRLDSQKRIDRALKFFYLVSKSKKRAQFIIIGPDSGEKINLKKIILDLGLLEKVKILDAMPISEIRKYAAKSSFFIQLSSSEGMAMSVIEAMQFGLIPIVTSVGEISTYCRDNFNSIIYDKNNDAENLKKVIKILDSPEKFMKISSKAIKTWTKSKTYKDDIVDTCIELSRA